jgi:hypothetical protein
MYWGASLAYDSAVFNSTTGDITPVGTASQQSTGTYNLSMQVCYWTGTGWSTHSYMSGYYTTATPVSGANYTNSSCSTIPACEPEETCQEEQDQAENSCGLNNWELVDEATCEYKCKCDTSDISRVVTQCGGPFFAEVDYETCEVICIPVSGECSSEHAALQEGCKPYGIEYFNSETCVGKCNTDCTEQWVELTEFCGVSQVEEKRVTDCWGECFPPPADCDNFRDQCERGCVEYGGIDEYYCDPSIESSICLCKVPQPAGNNTHDGLSPTENDPEPDLDDDKNDPTSDPDNDPDDGANGWLKGIKKNTDKIVDQNRDRLTQLGDIVDNTKTTAENTAIIAKNQGEIQDDIKRVGETVESLKGSDRATLSDVVDASETTAENVKNVEDGIESLKGAGQATLSDIVDAVNGLNDNATSSVVPELTGEEFNTELPDIEYGQYDDYNKLASDQAAAFAQQHLVIDPDSTPINADVTASGDPCLNGNITVHNTQVPVSICFNKTWMLQGYAIMKILMIGLAYLQTAILLNKAIAS